MSIQVTAQVIIAVTISAFLIGLSKGGLGGTIVVLVTPLLASVGKLSQAEAAGLALPLLIVGDGFAVWAFWRGWNRKVIVKLLPGTIIGVIVGLLLLRGLADATIKHGIALFVILFCLYRFLEPRLRSSLEHSEVHPWYAPIFGSGAGIASAVANAGGPLASMYMLMEHLGPVDFIATSALYFALVNAMKLPSFLLGGVLHPYAFLQIAWAIPLVPLGVWIGRWLIHHMNVKAFEKVILVLLLITAVVLLIT